MADSAGADSLVVQNPGVGGNRGMLVVDMEPSAEPLLERIDSAHDVPITAADCLGAVDVTGILRRGTVGRQVAKIGRAHV